MQRFNKVSTYSYFIKNLLATTYLPLIRSVREGDYICADRLYIFKCDIIKCNSSGFIGDSPYLSVSPIAKWTRIGEFHFGDKDGKLSTNYISNSEGYDYKTHERLGQYLRNLRDMYGLNLMPLYNCFSNQFLENHVIRNKKVRKTSDVGEVKIYKIPIRFNQDYTLLIENLGLTTVAPAFLRHNSILRQNNTPYGNSVDVTNQYISLHNNDNIKTYANLSFGKPVKIRFNNIPEVKKFKVNNFNTYLNRNYELEIEENKKYELPTTSLENSKTVYYESQIIEQETQYVEINPLPEDFPFSKVEGPLESGKNYYIKNDNNQFVLITEQPTGGEQVYTVLKNYYIAMNVLAPPINAQYEITNEVCSQYADLEDNLYLLIQVPKAFNQNIVLLEGDYTSLESQKYVDSLFINDLPDSFYDKFYTHDLNLMTATSVEPRPFSPILLEYLLWNVINNLDTINNDFDRLSTRLYAKYIPNVDDNLPSFPNFWFDRYRQLISDYVKHNSTNVLQDNLGYISKDIEGYIYNDIPMGGIG